MTRTIATLAIAVSCLPAPARAQQTALTEAHLKSAEIEIPKLVDLLAIKPGTTVADVGAGFGAWTMALSKVVGANGRVYATEIGAAQLAALREAVERERLTNVTVVEATAANVNLPPACCDAILIRDVYHHVTNPEQMVRGVTAALKPGGRLAVMDFPPRANSEVPKGVPANRRGHGVPAEIVESEFGAVLTRIRTIPDWSPESQPASLYLVLFQKPPATTGGGAQGGITMRKQPSQ
ncbi:MAG TPA: methyltransferase domain-containing protein [Vicinamibacterales bacterium]|nr:methyltransferase domain-containing protein [Vicinamibacterales bacterium]